MPHKTGDRVTITKLMLKLQSISRPNYQIAAALGIHPTTLSLYARGKKDISAAHLVSMCKFFECDAEELMGDIVVEIK